ncbi:hypothetical protein [Sorangium sp. So ce1000]|uniref:hypothetical protein n=1 Tax=Sorangium sp. So ce1000 TaxID=3133325 RepID=UPI003F6267B8
MASFSAISSLVCARLHSSGGRLLSPSRRRATSAAHRLERSDAENLEYGQSGRAVRSASRARPRRSGERARDEGARSRRSAARVALVCLLQRVLGLSISTGACATIRSCVLPSLR